MCLEPGKAIDPELKVSAWMGLTNVILSRTNKLQGNLILLDDIVCCVEEALMR